MMNYHEIINIIKNSKQIVILPHVFPDGDAIGSSGALMSALNLIGKDSCILIEDKIPSELSFLNLKSLEYDSDNFNLENFDLIITVDTSDLDRLGKRISLLQNKSIPVINIDHHKTNTNYGDYNWIDKNAAACGEMICQLILDLGIPLNDEIATFLYVAISTDTGSFKYSNTTSKTLRIAADLIDAGIDFEKINNFLYHNKPMGKVRLLIDSLNTLEFYYDNRLSIISLTMEMIKNNNVDFTDTDGIIEYGRDIMGVEVAILLKEIEKNEIKVGFRSKGNCDVSKIASFFGGGGHKNASGCTIIDTIEGAKYKILKQFEKEFS